MAQVCTHYIHVNAHSVVLLRCTDCSFNVPTGSGLPRETWTRDHGTSEERCWTTSDTWNRGQHPLFAGTDIDCKYKSNALKK